MNVLIILNFLTAIAAFAVLCRKRHFLFALVALSCAALYGHGIWHAGIHVDDVICNLPCRLFGSVSVRWVESINTTICLSFSPGYGLC